MSIRQALKAIDEIDSELDKLWVAMDDLTEKRNKAVAVLQELREAARAKATGSAA